MNHSELQLSSDSPRVSDCPPVNDGTVHPCPLGLLFTGRSFKELLFEIRPAVPRLGEFPLLFYFIFWGVSARVQGREGENWEEISHLFLTAFAQKGDFCFVFPVRLLESASAYVPVQSSSSSSVLILRVLTVSIESSWQLKEERKIGK